MLIAKLVESDNLLRPSSADVVQFNPQEWRRTNCMGCWLCVQTAYSVKCRILLDKYSPPASDKKFRIRSGCAQEREQKYVIASYGGKISPFRCGLIQRFDKRRSHAGSSHSFCFRCRTTLFERCRSEAPCFDSFGAA